MGTRILLASVSLLLCVCGASSTVGQDTEQRLVAAAEQTREWLASGNMAAVMEHIPDGLFPGGADGKRAAAALAEKSKGDAMELARSMRWDPPGTIRTVGNRLVCVMTYESTLRGKRMRACQIAVSDDKGRTWGFISGSRGAIDSLRKIAPELLAAIEDDIQPVEIGGLAVVDSAAWDRCFREPELPRGTGSVSVSLAWPDNIRRHVTRTMTRLVEGPNGMTSRRSTMSYEMIGEQSDEGYKILFGGVEVTYSEGLPEEDLLVRLDHASNCLGDWPVNFVVNDAAEIPRLTNLDEVGSELRRRYLAIQGVDSNPTARRMIETLLSEPVLTQRALGTWNKMVQVWHGNTFGFSRVFHHANEVVGMVVESDLTYSVHPSPVPVEDSGAKLIRLYVHQVPTGDVTSLIESFSKLQLPTGLSPLAEVTTWADASQELVPERFVKLLTFTIHDRGSRRDFRSGTRWEYRFEPPRK